MVRQVSCSYTNNSKLMRVIRIQNKNLAHVFQHYFTGNIHIFIHILLQMVRIQNKKLDHIFQLRLYYLVEYTLQNSVLVIYIYIFFQLLLFGYGYTWVCRKYSVILVSISRIIIYYTYPQYRLSIYRKYRYRCTPTAARLPCSLIILVLFNYLVILLLVYIYIIIITRKIYVILYVQMKVVFTSLHYDYDSDCLGSSIMSARSIFFLVYFYRLLKAVSEMELEKIYIVHEYYITLQSFLNKSCALYQLYKSY
eukprot:TRINITY_DN3429_c2_g2_i4.p2 TRINITY_DN3429_c2_g2~~TRINITY_DN3429_c2_g2_i4.p2  ORF type:complete len:252 (+),score=-29.30 TRINITY_DN3429_c2_g2_i4:287-1042(+)